MQENQKKGSKFELILKTWIMLRVAKKTKEYSFIVQDEIVIICLRYPEEPFDNKLEPVNYLIWV